MARTMISSRQPEPEHEQPRPGAHEGVEPGLFPAPGSDARRMDAPRSSEDPLCSPTSAPPAAPPVSCPSPWLFSVRDSTAAVGFRSVTFPTGCYAAGGTDAAPADRPGPVSRRAGTAGRVACPRGPVRVPGSLPPGNRRPHRLRSRGGPRRCYRGSLRRRESPAGGQSPLGGVDPAQLRHRRARVPRLRRTPRADRDHRRSGGDCADPASSGTAGDDPRPRPARPFELDYRSLMWTSSGESGHRAGCGGRIRVRTVGNP